MLETLKKIVVTTIIVIFGIVFFAAMLYVFYQFFKDLPLVFSPRTAEAAEMAPTEKFDGGPFGTITVGEGITLTITNGEGTADTFAIETVAPNMKATGFDFCGTQGDFGHYACYNAEGGPSTLFFPEGFCASGIEIGVAGRSPEDTTPVVLYGEELLPDCFIEAVWGGANNRQLTLTVTQDLPMDEPTFSIHTDPENGPYVLEGGLPEGCVDADGTVWNCSGLAGVYVLSFSTQGDHAEVWAQRWIPAGKPIEARWIKPTGLLNVRWVPFLQTQ